MPDWQILTAIGCIGLTSYAMRAGGFLAAGVLPANGLVQRFLRLAPGNLFVAFIAAGCLEGGIPNCLGAALALTTMAITGKLWAALAIGFLAAGAAGFALG